MINIGFTVFGIFLALIEISFCAFFSSRLAQIKGRSRAWGIFGFFFNIIGFIIVCFLPSKRTDYMNTNPITQLTSKIPAISKNTIYISSGILLAIVLTIVAYDNIPSIIQNYKYSKEITSQNKSDYEQATSVSGEVESVFTGLESTFVLTTNGDVYCFGKQHSPQIENAPTGVIFQNAKQISANEDICFILDNKNRLYAIGNNKNKLIPIKTPEEDTKSEFKLVSENVLDFSISETTVGIIKTDNKLYMYGNGVFGQLGTYNNENQSSPVSVLGNVISVKCEASFTVALQKSGEAVAFGENTFHQFGKEGKSFNSPTVIGNNISQIAAGDNYIMLLNKSGEVTVCGGGEYGQLGNLANNNITSFTAVYTNAKQISAAKKSSYILTNSNELYVFGQNTVGQLGTGSTDNINTPTLAATEVFDFEASGLHTVILTESGEVKVCGYNNCGQLGKAKSTTEFSTLVTIKE